MQGMRGGMEEVIQCIRGFYKCHLMTKNISSCLDRLDASYRQTKLKSVLCVSGTELEMEGGEIQQP